MDDKIQAQSASKPITTPPEFAKIPDQIEWHARQQQTDLKLPEHHATTMAVHSASDASSEQKIKEIVGHYISSERESNAILSHIQSDENKLKQLLNASYTFTASDFKVLLKNTIIDLQRIKLFIGDNSSHEQLQEREGEHIDRDLPKIEERLDSSLNKLSIHPKLKLFSKYYCHQKGFLTLGREALTRSLQLRGIFLIPHDIRYQMIANNENSLTFIEEATYCKYNQLTNSKSDVSDDKLIENKQGIFTNRTVIRIRYTSDDKIIIELLDSRKLIHDKKMASKLFPHLKFIPSSNTLEKNNSRSNSRIILDATKLTSIAAAETAAPSVIASSAQPVSITQPVNAQVQQTQASELSLVKVNPKKPSPLSDNKSIPDKTAPAPKEAKKDEKTFKNSLLGFISAGIKILFSGWFSKPAQQFVADSLFAAVDNVYSTYQRVWSQLNTEKTKENIPPGPSPNIHPSPINNPKNVKSKSQAKEDDKLTQDKVDEALHYTRPTFL